MIATVLIWGYSIASMDVSCTDLKDAKLMKTEVLGCLNLGVLHCLHGCFVHRSERRKVDENRGLGMS